MPNPTTTADVEARWRPLTDAETINAGAFLDDAWSLLLSRRPSLEDDLTAGTVSEGNVIRVMSAMVIRVLRNPEGLRAETIDDYSYTRDEALSAGLLYITADELADISPAGSRRFNSIRMVAYGDTS